MSLNLQTTMENKSDRRTENRTETAEHVDVYFNGEFVETCKLGDLSSSGAFLVASKLDVPLGSSLEIFFPLARGSELNRKALCMQAIVARRTENGVGVMMTSKSLVSLKGDRDMFML